MSPIMCGYSNCEGAEGLFFSSIRWCVLTRVLRVFLSVVLEVGVVKGATVQFSLGLVHSRCWGLSN